MDGSYGSPNGTEWTGLVGMVARKEVDFIINGLAFVYDRAMVRNGYPEHITFPNIIFFAEPGYPLIEYCVKLSRWRPRLFGRSCWNFRVVYYSGRFGREQ